MRSALWEDKRKAETQDHVRWGAQETQPLPSRWGPCWGTELPEITELRCFLGGSVGGTKSRISFLGIPMQALECP